MMTLASPREMATAYSRTVGYDGDYESETETHWLAGFDAALDMAAAVAERWEHSPALEVAGQIRALKAGGP